jgi:DNA repair protein RadC
MICAGSINQSKTEIMTNYRTCRKLSIVQDKDGSFAKTKIQSSAQSADYLRQFWGDDMEIFESFFLLLLSQSNQTIGYVKISQGGVAGTVVDVSIVAKYAIETLSRAVVLCHNHPSGNTNPSEADIELTAKIKSGLKLFDIQVVDHVILTADSYYSFADNGIL